MDLGNTQPVPARSAPLTLTLGDVLLAAGGLLIFIFSFLPWISLPSVKVPLLGTVSTGGSQNAFGDLTGALPVFVFIAGILMIAFGLLRQQFGERQVLGFTMPQIQVMVGLFAVLMMLADLFTNRHGLDLGVGAILTFISALVALCGATLNHLNIGRVIYPTARPAVTGPGV